MIHPEEIEACYAKSLFIKEVCVVSLARDDEPASQALYAVVVPNMELMRARRVANVGDLIRFEMEGQSIQLPPHRRVLNYGVSFEPLPRTTTGELKRYEIQRTLLQKRRNAEIEASEPARIPHQWVSDPLAAAIAEIVARRAVDAVVRPTSNLELDLGFDSIQRVELLSELEQRFGIKLQDDDAHTILSVQQLIEIVRLRTTAPTAAPFAAEETWGTLLRDLPPASDHALAALVAHRPIMRPLLFAVLRLLSLALPRVHATGLNRLPSTGPYIITPNHQGYLDPFFICSVLPYRIVSQLFFLGAAEYFESPVAARFARLCNLLPVDPDANLVAAMRAGAFGLSRGKILVLFPEGERSIDGTVKRFKKGAPILSRHLGAPIVPVAIDGAYQLWPRNRAFNWRLLLPWSGHRIRIAFGAPVTFDKWQADADAAAHLRDTVHSIWEGLDRSR